jgi:hypothetical protein
MYIKVTITWRHEGDQETWSKVYWKACNRKYGHKVGSSSGMEREVERGGGGKKYLPTQNIAVVEWRRIGAVANTVVILAAYKICPKGAARSIATVAEG